MARWDKFLNEASRGYGTGFQRYQQYADARDTRLNRQDAQTIQEQMAVLGQQRGQAGPQQSQMTYEQPGGAVGGAIPVGAVGTAAQPTLAVPADIPRPDMGTMVDDEAALIRNQFAVPDKMPPTDYSGGPLRSLANEPGAGQAVPMGEAPRPPSAAAQSPSKEIPNPNYKAGAAKKDVGKKGESDTAKQSAIQEVALVMGPNKGKVPIRDLIQEFSVKNNVPTAEVWDTVEKKMMDIAIRSGDYEAVLNIPQKIATMQQERMLSTLQQAHAIVDVDPVRAGELITKAYSYYPDGVASQFRIQNGKLVGYGWDEATGDFKGAQVIAGDDIGRLMEKISDPIQYSKDVRAAKAAAEQTAYDRAEDKKKHALDVANANSEHLLNLAQAAKNKAEAGSLLAEAMATGSSGSWVGKGKDLANLHGKFDSHVKDVLAGNNVGSPLVNKLFSGELKGVNPNKVQEVGNALIAAQGPQGQKGPTEVMEMAAALTLLSAANSGIPLEDSGQDREWEQTMNDMRAGKGRITGVVHDPDSGQTGFLWDGNPQVLPTAMLLGLGNIPTDAERQAAANQPQTAVPSDYTPVEGQPLNTKQALGVIGGTAMDALGTGVDVLGKVAANSPPVRATEAALDLGKKGIQSLGETLREPPGKPQGRGSKSKAAPAMDNMIDALIMAESGGNPMAVSPVGAQGLAQVMPATARDPGFGVTPLEDPFDPVQSRRFAKEYLGAMLKRYKGNLPAALVAYNAGPGNADKFVKAGNDFSVLPKRSETEPYVKKITGALR